MKIIYKYKIPFAPASTQLMIHRDAQLLDAQLQEGIIVLWARVDTENTPGPRIITSVMTGEQLTDKTSFSKYIATVQYEGFVSHIFDDGEIIQ